MPRARSPRRARASPYLDLPGRRRTVARLARHPYRLLDRATTCVILSPRWSTLRDRELSSLYSLVVRLPLSVARVRPCGSSPVLSAAVSVIRLAGGWPRALPACLRPGARRLWGSGLIAWVTPNRLARGQLCVLPAGPCTYWGASRSVVAHHGLPPCSVCRCCEIRRRRCSLPPSCLGRNAGSAVAARFRSRASTSAAAILSATSRRGFRNRARGNTYAWVVLRLRTVLRLVRHAFDSDGWMLL